MALFDPKKNKKISATLEDLKFKKEDDIVPIRKPRPNEIIQVKGETLEDLVEIIATEQKDSNGDNQTYIVQPDNEADYSKLAEALGNIRRILLAPCLTTFEEFFLWEVKLEANGKVMDAHRSSRRCCELAQQQWIKVIWDHRSKRYVAHVPTHQEGFPETLNWPEEDIVTLINKAYSEDRIINGFDHEVARRALSKAIL